MKPKVLIKKIFSKDNTYFNKLKYIKFIKKYQVKEKNIFVEPQQGRTINGNMFYIIKELTTNELYKDYKIYVALKKEDKENSKQILMYNNIKNVIIIDFNSKEYYKLLATSKYLITDTSFPQAFIKKDGQKILNTWHGTPLKYLGKKIKNDFHSIGNVQKNFIVSDYLLYPNEYTESHMIEDYMLENICNAKVMLAGYPRNTVFFDRESENTIKKELNLENKEVFVYMPTWRETSTIEEIELNKECTTKNLLDIDKRLNENQILYVNLHPLERKNIDFTIFSKIKEFPRKYETYQFLNIADCLITDYSSVFFDFAITRKKIILFCYDEKEYLNNRGLYFDYRELPFTKARTIEELLNALNNKKDYNENEFIQQFCKYDSKDITSKICETFILDKKNDLIIDSIKNNKKDNILIYVGNLAKNGITSSLTNLLHNIDINNKNYYLTFSTNKIIKNKEQLLNFPENVKYISTTGKTNMTILQKLSLALYKKDLIPQFIMNKVIEDVYSNEIKRLYGNIKFNSVIQFGGYEYKKILLYSAFDCNKIIYVHSDMINEIKYRKNQHKRTLKYAYNKYNKVAVVTKGMFDSTYKISGRKDNIFVVDNIINYKDVLEKANMQNIVFEECTESNISLDELNKILGNKNKKFITIGRFSPEKGHYRLIESFNKIYNENPNVNLIIIGGAGKQYEKTIKYVNTLTSGKNIALIKNMSNPYTILKRCDYFVLSSFYEGFGLVLAEADILNIPVISTDISGPRNFIIDNKGTLVENTKEGIYNGMKQMLNGEIKTLNVDYEVYNKKAINEFYNLFK